MCSGKEKQQLKVLPGLQLCVQRMCLLLSCSLFGFPCTPQANPIYLQSPLPSVSILFSFSSISKPTICSTPSGFSLLSFLYRLPLSSNEKNKYLKCNVWIIEYYITNYMFINLIQHNSVSENLFPQHWDRLHVRFNLFKQMMSRFNIQRFFCDMHKSHSVLVGINANRKTQAPPTVHQTLYLRSKREIHEEHCNKTMRIWQWYKLNAWFCKLFKKYFNEVNRM